MFGPTGSSGSFHACGDWLAVARLGGLALYGIKFCITFVLWPLRLFVGVLVSRIGEDRFGEGPVQSR